MECIVDQFIGHCLIPLDPWFVPLCLVLLLPDFSIILIVPYSRAR